MTKKNTSNNSKRLLHKDALLDLVRKKWRTALSVLIILVATLSFFWPMVTNISTYSSGGDHMFNAWTLARNHHCLLRQGCPDYNDANIFFPNEDTMLYSETQFSAGLLTLPFHFINNNPLFANNMWHIISALLTGVFMYMLVMYISKGKQALSVLAGLVFEFAPTKITAMGHLQNLSIFYLPLITLLLLKYKDTGRKIYLALFAIASSLLFLASWYQMVFGLVVIGLFIIFVFLDKETRRKGLLLTAATIIAIATTFPLAKEYVRFSKTNNASFSLSSQIAFSASLNDYLTPYEGTPFGELYYSANPNVQRNAYNSDSYSYAGISLYAILVFCVFQAFRRRNKVFKENRRLVILLAFVFLAGFLMSLGPVVKFGSQTIFAVQGTSLSFPAPYILVDIFLPQLSFIRAIGRASVIGLFALSSILGIFALWIASIKAPNKRWALLIGTIIVVSLDVLPVRALVSSPFKQVDAFNTSYHMPDVYKFIDSQKDINNIVILRTQSEYPGVGTPTAQVEDVLWAGYHNRNIFNGYSGYQPPDYQETLEDIIDLQADDITKLRELGIRFVIIDKALSPANTPLRVNSDVLLGESIYEDNRYILYTIPTED